jgi:hypothetical protein
VTMAADKVAISRLVLGPVPSVHDGKLAVVHLSTSIGLSLASVLAAASLATAVLKPTAVYEVSFEICLP